jgi:hypothetical protein
LQKTAARKDRLADKPHKFVMKETHVCGLESIKNLGLLTTDPLVGDEPVINPKHEIRMTKEARMSEGPKQTIARLTAAV